ncbi:hypothetical protein CXF83_15735 [Shewanella sp. Choline-02u-19]|uniref:PepSY domain-containing protein n=1 Tax=unclassified Shewanella TaxID=196818 RepID=UPI000C32FEF8|nr:MULTISPECIES: PepSY domain-containing protein [unclassified Shewanella]PKH60969.1 hypothetical protein CXF84_01790 [Shewanella sp. Bg11-22]PKI28062.1 hypothetical protein CXF83_15735 [Shewanella sp. Choline-02u-19]
MRCTKLICAALAFTSISAFAGQEDDALAALALQRANYTLEQAIEKVSTDYAKHIVEFEIDDHDNQATYDIEAINLETKEKHNIELSLADGAILKHKTQNSLSRLDDDDLLALQELQASKFNLRATIAQLQLKYSADVFEFELKNKKGITFYKFKLMGDQGLTRVIVDVTTGKAIPVMKR